MKVPDEAYNHPFCVVSEPEPGKVHTHILYEPKRMHDAFESLPSTIPAYALNYGLIVRSQNV